MPNRARSTGARIGAYESWARTVDRTARTQPARDNGPAGVDYWIAQLDPERFAAATDEQRRAAALALKRAHYARLARARWHRGGGAA